MRGIRLQYRHRDLFATQAKALYIAADRNGPLNVMLPMVSVEKDVTDTVAAFYEGVKRGFKSFVLFGGTGGRFEHTYANVSLMAKATKEGCSFTIVDDMHIFRCVFNSTIKIKRKDNQQVSVFAYGGIASGVTEKGFHYSLENYDLDPLNGCLGTSNHVVDDFGEITVENGTIIVIETKM